jgi:hypothetical protein
MSRSSPVIKPAVYVALAVYIALTYTVLAMGNNAVSVTIPEDHYFEIIGAFSLLVTSLLFLYGFFIARKSLEKTWASLVKQWVYLGLAALFFFGAGEEISWGQRILGFQTPASLTEVNKQEEFNFHNLSVLENSDLFTADRMFDAFWFLFAVLMPAVALALPAFRRFASRFIPIVHWGIGLLFVYNYLWAKAAKVIYQAAYVFDKISLTQAVQEIKESNYAIVFILVGWFAVWDLRHSKQTGSVPVEGGNIRVKPAYRD